MFAFSYHCFNTETEKGVLGDVYVRVLFGQRLHICVRQSWHTSKYTSENHMHPPGGMLCSKMFNTLLIFRVILFIKSVMFFRNFAIFFKNFLLLLYFGFRFSFLRTSVAMFIDFRSDHDTCKEFLNFFGFWFYGFQ